VIRTVSQALARLISRLADDIDQHLAELDC
jgi:hypothetical protein